LDNGKALSMAKADVGMAAGCLRYYGGWADKIEGKVIDTIPGTFNYTKQEPVSSPFSQFRVTLMGVLADSTSFPDWRLWSDHPLELSSPHVVVEGWSRHLHW